MDLGVCVTYIFVHIHIYVHIYISMHMIIIIKESKAITLKWDMRVAWGGYLGRSGGRKGGNVILFHLKTCKKKRSWLYELYLYSPN